MRFIAVLLGLVLLAGCSAPAPSAPAPPTPPGSVAAESSQPAGLAHSVPTVLDIPKIEVHSTLVQLGLNSDDTIEVPPVSTPLQAGWYSYSPTPGEIGPAIILGHVDGGGQKGIFYRLKELLPGDQISVSRQDGSTARFAVTKVDQISKSEFSADDVYGDTAAPELRLITCGGSFDRAAHSYRDNIIVYAALVG
ncbi:class F sortase [Amycolatopsis taiwanensis]|uniref:class F sortase n=1 Tax=Amycolatopsis taiwanensis TaxID=342230 RepID=UPI000487735E|nr:class F sortase [Amycolatopsis taiwanensis]